MAAMMNGCGPKQSGAAPDAKPDGVRLGETVRVDGPTVTPLSVLEDSRCPKGATCIWAGRVRLSVRVDLGSGSDEHELTLGAPVHVADGELELTRVLPDAIVDRTIAPEDYRFTFSFSGGI
jgi:hypothetical protein